MIDLIIQNASLHPSVVSIRPSLTTWSRLELLPATSDLAPGLQAQVADPLWLLGRQWQFSEFQGEDAGTPVEVQLNGEAARLSRYLPGGLGKDPASRAMDYQHLQVPLETAVESEAIRPTHPRLAAEAGLHFLRLLAAEGAANMATRYRNLKRYKLADIQAGDAAADPRGDGWASLLAGRGMDGHALAVDLRPFAGPDYTFTSLPAVPAIPTASAAAVRRAASRWLRWFDETFKEPPAQALSAWDPSRQEYALALGARFEKGEATLIAEEYTDGRLDWHTFRIATKPSLFQRNAAGAPIFPPESAPLKIELRPRMPVLARYPGMPADRFWEFEDGRVYLAGLDAGPTDLSRLLLVEFTLVYGNDWFVVPVELPIGSLFRMGAFTVKDTFGVQTKVDSTRQSVGGNWTIFSLTPLEGEPERLRDLYFLPPTLPGRLQSEPLEELALFRDEMANLVWGVERKVSGASGEAYDRSLESRRLAARQELPGAQADAELIYRLMTPVPENWIPFTPVPASANLPAGQFVIELERQALLRTLPDGSHQTSQPHGLLLRTDPTQDPASEPPLRLKEEEVPREGIVVRRSFQYCRWLGGQAYVWLGRDKFINTGEGASGLIWDKADKLSA
jgi:hypothetical protein